MVVAESDAVTWFLVNGSVNFTVTRSVTVPGMLGALKEAVQVVESSGFRVSPTTTGAQVKLRAGMSSMEVKVPGTLPVLVTTAVTKTVSFTKTGLGLVLFSTLTASSITKVVADADAVASLPVGSLKVTVTLSVMDPGLTAGNEPVHMVEVPVVRVAPNATGPQVKVTLGTSTMSERVAFTLPVLVTIAVTAILSPSWTGLFVNFSAATVTLVEGGFTISLGLSVTMVVAEADPMASNPVESVNFTVTVSKILMLLPGAVKEAVQIVGTPGLKIAPAA